MRRQTTCGVNSAGSSCALRLDPQSIPVRFSAHDARADGNVRQIELHRERVILRRSLHGMRIAINVRVSDFLGIAQRVANDDSMLVLVHRDPSLSIPLLVTSNAEELEQAAQVWRDVLSLPEVAERFDRSRGPAPRRRRHNAVKWRHPRVLLRRCPGGPLSEMDVYRGEREIIARS